MKNSYVTFLALLALSVLSTSCGDAAGKKLGSSNSKTTQFLRATSGHLDNFSQAMDNISGTSTCDPVTGFPTATLFSDLYNTQSIPCTLKTNTIQSFNTVRGIMSLFSGLMCAIEDQVDFNYAPSVTTHSVTLDSLDPCLSGLSFGSAGTYSLVVKEQSLTLSNWSYKISIDFSTGTYAGKRMYVFIREDGNRIGMKISIGTVIAGVDTDFTGLFIDRNDGSNVIRLDMISNLRHNRAYIQGGNSEYSSIGIFYGAHSATSGGGVVSLLTASNSTKYRATTGNTCSSPDCTGVTNPSLNFSNFSAGNLSNLTTYLTDNTNGVLSFSNASPDFFFPQ